MSPLPSSRRSSRALLLAALAATLPTALAAQSSGSTSTPVGNFGPTGPTSAPTSGASPIAPQPTGGVTASPLATASGAPTLNSTNNGSAAISGLTSAGIQQDDTRFTQPTTSLLQDQRSGIRAAPYGSAMFSVAPAAPNSTLIDPSYQLKPGDQVSLAMWGLVDQNITATVDTAGNIVVPGVGPVNVSGVPANQVNSVVQQAASSVYKNSVQLYATPSTVGVTNVYVAGQATKPGSYSGAANDNLITYLQRAGGPQFERGSYRDILIKRKGQTIGQLDLYAFLINGTLPDVRLREGDMIVIGPQHPIVTVTGDVRAPFTFEFAGQTATGSELIYYTRPDPSVTNVAVLGIRNNKPTNFYMPLSQFSNFVLSDGDRVRFQSDVRSDTYVVTVEGAFEGSSTFTVARGARLGSVLSQLHYDPQADFSVIHLQRVSVALTQKQLLDESLARLQKVMYTTPSPTPDIAQARSVDALALQNYITQARAVMPPGLVALPPQGPERDNVMLEPDDQIVIPFRSEVISVGGEVVVPQSLIWRPGKDALWYVKTAGGFSQRAKKSGLLVIRADGTTHNGGPVLPGDRVLAPPKAGSVVFELIKDITSILSGFGIAAAAVTRF